MSNIYVSDKICRYADVAQLVEHHLAKVRVAGSNPVIRSATKGRPRFVLVIFSPAVMAAGIE